MFAAGPGHAVGGDWRITFLGAHCSAVVLCLNRLPERKALGLRFFFSVPVEL